MGKDNWKTIKFEELGANASNADFEGLIGFEECHDYDILSSKKNNAKRKKKLKTSEVNNSSKKSKKSDFKVKLSNDNNISISEIINGTVEDSSKNSETKTTGEPIHIMQLMKLSKKSKKRKKKMKKTNVVISKNENDETVVEENKLSFDDVQAWSSFGIPEVILRALAEQGFQKPTTIQELTLPAALHGRRDILGAAETGSGKTLAFGIPILSGILGLKEKLTRGDVEDVFCKNKKDIYSFHKSDEKIVNMNKLSKKEIAKLKKPYKNIQMIKKLMKTHKSRRNEDDSNDESSGFESNDDSESDVDDESDKNDNENSENDIDDEFDKNNASEGSNDENSENDSTEENGSNEKALKVENGFEDNSNSESDFEEREEQVDDINDKGIGCVRVIDNIDSVEIAENNIVKSNLKPLYALILTPTRELAIQVKNHLVAAAKHTDIRIAVVVGGMAQVKQERILDKGPEIVVATPGRLWEMIQQGNDHLSQVNDIRYLAIDETDRMIERGHFEELHLLLDKINDDESKKSLRQNFVFSATLTLVHDLPFHLKAKKVTKRGKVIKKKFEKLTSEQKLKKVIELLGITNPKVVDVTEKNRGSSNTLTECRISCSIDHKDYYLFYVLKKHPGRTIVFCNSIGCVKRLSQLFSLLLCKPLPLHASMQQRQRLKNLDRFRNDPNGLLIATDVAARGLDIPNVEHVIHYQVPRTAENYVHRSGRTARANKDGITILIMEPGEVQNYVKFCRTLAKDEDLPHFPVIDALLSATKQRVNLAREVDQLELRIRKANSELGWYEKSMREMDIVLDEREMPHKTDKATAAEQKSLLAMKKKQLNSLLATQMFPKGFSFKYPTSNDILEGNLAFSNNQNAVEAMRSALQSGLVKQLKRTTKNQAHLSLVGKKPNSVKLRNKNKWKKMKRNKANPS